MFFPISAVSNPGIICPDPIWNCNGSFPSEESKTSPSRNLPV
jgi:hypothetical protein